MKANFQVSIAVHQKVERVAPNALSDRPLAIQRVEDNALHLGMPISRSGGLR